MRKIIDQDICVRCAFLIPLEPLPDGGQFEIEADCSLRWPGKVSPSTNAINTCPQFSGRLPLEVIWNFKDIGSRREAA